MSQLAVTIVGWSITLVVLVANIVFTVIQSRKIERLKADFRKEVIEYEVKFGKFHERRVEVIEELYLKLLKAQGSLASITSFLQFVPQDRDKKEYEKEQYGLAYTEFAEFRNFFLTAKLYLGSEEVALIDEMDKHLVKTWAELHTKLVVEKQSEERGMELWIKAEARVNQLMTPLIDRIQVLFKEALSTNSEDSGRSK